MLGYADPTECLVFITLPRGLTISHPNLEVLTQLELSKSSLVTVAFVRSSASVGSVGYMGLLPGRSPVCFLQ